MTQTLTQPQKLSTGPGPKRELLLESSLELFRSRGYHNTRIEDIINHAKVGKGTFYLYFKNKEEVVSILLENFINEVISILDWVENSISGDAPPSEVFTQEGVQLTDLFYKRKKLARFLFREIGSINDEVYQKLRLHYRDLIQRIERTYELGLKMGIVKDVDPKYAAWSIMGSILFIYQMWLEEEIQDTPEQIMEKILEFYLGALNVNKSL